MMRMVDMASTPEEKEEAAERMVGTMPDAASMPTYPWGLCLRLDQDSMDKLGMEGLPQVGDLLHFTAMAKVTSVRASDNEYNGPDCCVELQIQQMGVPEDENTEEPSPGKMSRPKRYGG